MWDSQTIPWDFTSDITHLHLSVWSLEETGSGLKLHHSRRGRGGCYLQLNGSPGQNTVTASWQKTTCWSALNSFGDDPDSWCSWLGWKWPAAPVSPTNFLQSASHCSSFGLSHMDPCSNCTACYRKPSEWLAWFLLAWQQKSQVFRSSRFGLILVISHDIVNLILTLMQIYVIKPGNEPNQALQSANALFSPDGIIAAC